MRAGTKGNKTEQAGPLLYSTMLAAPAIAFYVYFMQFQTFVWAPAAAVGQRCRRAAACTAAAPRSPPEGLPCC
jgi:hypothetical protein